MRRGAVARTAAVLGGVAILASAGWIASCHGSRSRLVEQFDNGPFGGPPGGSEGYYWVHASDLPTPGKHWRSVDPATLTPEQKKQIHGILP